MSMNPLVISLKAALESAGISTGSTQDAVIMAATTYIAGISKPEKGEWLAPAPSTSTPTTKAKPKKAAVRVGR